MDKKSVFTRILAVTGMVLVWLPILAPILFSAIVLIKARIFRFDYLMPAELFPVALVGSGLLLWVAFRARSHRRLISWGIATAIILLVGSQGIAVVTGLASGATKPGGWQWTLVLTVFAGFCLALITVGVSGILLVRDLFKPSQLPT